MDNYTMHWKSFFTRVFASIGIIIFAIILLITMIIVFGRYTMHKVPQGQTAPQACYVAGRSGGHLIPAMTLAQQHRSKFPKAPIYIFTANTQLDLFVMKKYPWITKHVTLPLGNVPRGFTLSWFYYVKDLMKTTIKTFNTLRRTNPVFVATTGGYIAVPVCLIARALGIPVYLYNLDVAPGAAIHFLSRFANKVTVCFAETKDKLPTSAIIEISSYPIRFNTQDQMNKQEARQKLNLGLTQKNSVLLVIGGSQGSHFINDLVPAAVAPWAKEKDLFVLHQTGEGEVLRVRALYDQYKVQALVFPYRDDMAVLYQAADLAITRAGAGSLFELAFFKTPAIIIPLVSATTAHQVDNALAIARQYPLLFTVKLQEGIDQHFGELLKSRLNATR